MVPVDFLLPFHETEYAVVNICRIASYGICSSHLSSPESYLSPLPLALSSFCVSPLLSFPFHTAGAADLFCLEKSHQLQSSENISKLTLTSLQKTNQIIVNGVFPFAREHFLLASVVLEVPAAF